MCVVTDARFVIDHQEGSVGRILNTTGSGWKGHMQKNVFVPKPVRTFILICYNEVKV
jgi:hypothetical protein